MTPSVVKAAVFVSFLLVGLLVPTELAQSQNSDSKIGRSGPPSPWVPIAASETYAALWALNVVCLDEVYGHTGVGAGVPRPLPITSLDQIQWHVAGDSVFINRDHQEVYGQFFPPDTIVLAGRYLFHPRLVRHEMLHAQGVGEHSVVPFVACGLWSGSLMEVFHP